MSSFEDILVWNSDRIRENVTLVSEKVKSVISAEDNETEIVVEYALFTVDSVLLCTPIGEWEDLFVKNVAPILVDIFTSAVRRTEAVDVDLTQTGTQSESFLQLCIKILNSLRECCSIANSHTNLKFHCVKSFLFAVDSIATEAYGYCKDCSRVNGRSPSLSEFLKLSSDVHALYVKILTNSLQISLKDDQEVGSFQKLVEELAKRSVLSLDLEVPVTAETWKGLLGVVEKYSNILKSNITCTLNKLCHRIISNVDECLKCSSGNLKECIQPIKISHFLLKILIKLCRLLQGSLSDILEKVTDLLLLLFRSTPSYLKQTLNSDVLSEITRQLVIAAEPLLATLIPEAVFPIFLCEKIKRSAQDNPYGCLVLLLSLFKKMTLYKSREPFFCENANVFELVFLCLGSCHTQSLLTKLKAPGSIVAKVKQDNFYQWAFTGTAVFILTLTGSEFPLAERTLLANVLQENSLKAVFAADLWCLVARYGSAELCHGAVNVLVPFLHSMDFTTHRPEFIHLRWLIKRLVPLCESEYLSNLTKKFPPMENLHAWRTIGLSEFTFDDGTDVIDDLLSVVRNWLGSQDEDVREFEKAVDSLHALSTVSWANNISEGVLEVVQNLWKVDFASVEPGNNSFSHFIEAVYAFTASIIPSLPSHIIIFVLHRIHDHLQFGESSSQLLFLDVLGGLATLKVSSEHENKFTQSLANVCKIVLKSTTTVHLAALRSFAQFAHATSHTDVIQLTVADDPSLQTKFVEFLEKKLTVINTDVPLLPKPMTFTHTCPTKTMDSFEENEAFFTDFGENPCKRFKPEMTMDSSAENLPSQDLDLIVHRFHNNAVAILKNYHRLNSDQVAKLKSVLNDFKTYF